MNTSEDFFVIKGLSGKRKLSGSVVISGSKNSVLPTLASSLIFKSGVNYTNVPNIEDVNRSRELLEHLGANIEIDDKCWHIDTSAITSGTLNKDIAKRMRASIVFVGPLLARFNEVEFPYPGGCVLGERPIDIFLESFEKMGADVLVKEDKYIVSTKSGLHGAELFLKVQSVTATETLMMAAAIADGKTIIDNCAMDPEVVHLANFLESSGANIKGAGTPTINIIGSSGKLLEGKRTFETPPDRLEAGSFLILGALCAESLEIVNCLPSELSSLIERLRKAGVDIVVKDNSMIVRAPDKLFPVSFRTHEYPGFPTDLQAPMVVLLTQADGSSHVFETIFEGRLHYISDLNLMGAHIKLLSDRQIEVHGPHELNGKELKSPDIRAGLAFIIAAAIAKGISTINDIYLIDRGYEDIENKLQGIGLDIKREIV